MNHIKISVTCSKYEHDAPIIKSIKKLIENGFRKAFFAVIVHGSMGTNEIQNYSDFDGLLIIKDQYKDARLLMNFFRKSMRLIYGFEPLQHHGWFIIYESQLKDYPQTYFPYELFNYSKTIYPDSSIEFEIALRTHYDFNAPLEKLSNNILNMIDFRRPTTLYELKGLLSQFMLLPCLYIQKKEQRGVFKRESFDLLRKWVDKDDFKIMDEISEIRSNWNYKLSPVQKWFLMRQNKYLRRVLIPLFSPRIPTETSRHFEDRLYREMKLFIKKIQN